jgi:hypothetical protein
MGIKVFLHDALIIIKLINDKYIFFYFKNTVKTPKYL